MVVLKPGLHSSSIMGLRTSACPLEVLGRTLRDCLSRNIESCLCAPGKGFLWEMLDVTEHNAIHDDEECSVGFDRVEGNCKRSFHDLFTRPQETQLPCASVIKSICEILYDHVKNKFI